MDETIAEQEGMSIPELFETKGEEYFRDAETALLRDLESNQKLLYPAAARQFHACLQCGGDEPEREGDPADCDSGDDTETGVR